MATTFFGLQIEDQYELEMDILGIMMRTDPEQCYNLMICSMSTGNSTFWDSPLKPIMNILLVPKIDDFLPPRTRDAKTRLYEARKAGQMFRDVEECENLYPCPFPTDLVDSAVRGQLQTLAK